MNNTGRSWIAALLVTLCATSTVQAYPIDGYEDTGIRRVEGVRMVEEGTIPGSKQPPARRWRPPRSTCACSITAT